jgi:enoyl-CoA hydratase/carnithine racemase
MRASEDGPGARDDRDRGGQGLLLRRGRQGHERAQDQGGERPLGEKVAPGRDRTVLALRDTPKPVIAAVNGAAAGPA